MVTGDNRRTAEAIARAVGIARDAVEAEVLPADKAALVRKLQQKRYRVAMVGDGINDAPALMQADVGIAIGAGTDIAIESSDVILIGNRVGAVVDAREIGAASYRKTVQNLWLAFFFNGLGVPLATTGLLHPAWAMIAMAASVSAVLANSFAGRLVKPRAGLAEAEGRRALAADAGAGETAADGAARDGNFDRSRDPLQRLRGGHPHRARHDRRRWQGERKPPGQDGDRHGPARSRLMRKNPRSCRAYWL